MIDAVEWSQNKQASFEVAAAFAAEMADQERIRQELFDSERALDTKDLRALAHDHLAAQQTETFTQLAQAAGAAPYEELGQRQETIEQQLARISLQLAETSEALAPDVAVIEQDTSRLSELLPDVATEAAESAQQLIQRLIDHAHGPLLDKKEFLELEQVALAEASEKYGGAWPIPQLVPAAARLAIMAGDTAFSYSREVDQREAWEVDFRSELHNALEKLYDWELLEDTVVVWGTVSQRSTSNKVGTEAMMDKAVRQGIISKAFDNKKATVSTARVACMLMQDLPAFRQATSTTARTKQAFAIADELTQQWLTAKAIAADHEEIA